MQGDELDRLLDSALAEYARAPERPGLTERVLRRVRDDAARRGWRRWLPWAWGLPALAAGTVAVVVLWMPRDPGPPASVQLARIEPPALAVAARVPVPPARPRVAATAPPRRRVFPTPSPLTLEERALYALATEHSDQLASYADDLRHSTDPVRIEPISIEPLTHGGN